MIQFETLFKISYGLYIVCSGDKNAGNGFISNTIFQVTSEPAKFAACCNKNNFTAEFIQKCGAFSVSVLSIDASPEIISRFGYKSGRDFDKMAGMHLRYCDTGVPVVIEESVAFLEFRVVQTVDAGTHWIFIAEMLNAEILNDEKAPMTYQYYRDVRKGSAPRNAPTYIDKSKLGLNQNKSISKKYKCIVCGYIYDENDEPLKFTDLPDDWVCPVCDSGKSDFIEI